MLGAYAKVTKMGTIWHQMRQELSFVRDRMSQYANKKRIEGPTFKRGDMVYLA